MRATSNRGWIFFGTLLCSAFLLNWAWEVAQAGAYAPHGTQSEAMRRCTFATFADAAITLGLYAIGALAAKRLYWGLRGGWNVYLTCALLGFIHAVLVEKQATASGRWSYSSHMPIIPVLEVGLLPVLQLTFLVPLSVWIASCVHSRKGSKIS
jgi:hypothetical protein